MSDPTISVIFPWRAGDNDRQNSLNYVVKWYQDIFPDAEIIFSDDDDPVMFNRGRALNLGVKKSKGDILILADGDLLISPKSLRRAVELCPEVGMVVPFSAINYMNRGTTRRILGGSNPFVHYAGMTPFNVKSQGGCNVLTRKSFEAAGGFDVRFRGWGFEDAAFSVMVRLYSGPMHHEPGHAVHLYHQTARNPYNGYYEESKALCEEYEILLKNSSVKPSKEDKNYCIKFGYKARDVAADFNDTQYTDQYQKEVYATAAQYMHDNCWSSVIDVGCGSGFKLIKYMGDYNTIGLDVPNTLIFLKEKYPDRKWLNALETDYSKLSTDLVITSDVIEHVKDPKDFIEKLLDIECNLFIISTPDRDLIRGIEDFGPPANVSHYREWNSEEFKTFLSLWFDIKDFQITNKSQGTMMAVCTRKERF